MFVSVESGEAAVAPRVHLDAASGLPLHARAREVWLAAVEDGWADPLRLHSEGRTARLLLDNAREAMAEILGCRADELSFTSSGTTACHLGVLGLRRGRERVGLAVVHSAVEHSAVLEACGWHDAAGPANQGRPPPVSVGVTPSASIDLDAWNAAVAGPGGRGCMPAGRKP